MVQIAVGYLRHIVSLLRTPLWGLNVTHHFCPKGNLLRSDKPAN